MSAPISINLLVMALLFLDKVSTEFRDGFQREVKRIARKYRMNPNWLMGVMNSETGGSFRADQKNYAGSGATGLIQFMPSTARQLGTSTTALAQMDEVEQLDWVDKYIDYTLKHVVKRERIRDYDDLYLMVFYPAAVGKPDNWLFPGFIYRQNAGVDVDQDGRITVSDFKAFIRKKIPLAYMSEFTARYRWLSARYLVFALVVIGLLAGGYFLAKKYYLR